MSVLHLVSSRPTDLASSVSPCVCLSYMNHGSPSVLHEKICGAVLTVKITWQHLHMSQHVVQNPDISWLNIKYSSSENSLEVLGLFHTVAMETVCKYDFKFLTLLYSCPGFEVYNLKGGEGEREIAELPDLESVFINNTDNSNFLPQLPISRKGLKISHC